MKSQSKKEKKNFSGKNTQKARSMFRSHKVKRKDKRKRERIFDFVSPAALRKNNGKMLCDFAWISWIE